MCNDNFWCLLKACMSGAVRCSYRWCRACLALWDVPSGAAVHVCWIWDFCTAHPIFNWSRFCSIFFFNLNPLTWLCWQDFICVFEAYTCVIEAYVYVIGLYLCYSGLHIVIEAYVCVVHAYLCVIDAFLCVIDDYICFIEACIMIHNTDVLLSPTLSYTLYRCVIEAYICVFES